MNLKIFTVGCALLFAAGTMADPGPNTRGAEVPSKQARSVVSVPFTTPGAVFEDTPDTVFHWTADDYNLLRFPESFAASAWTATNATVTAGNQTDPNGVANASATLTSSSAGGNISQTVNIGSSGTYTLSLWLKNISGATDARIRAGGASCSDTTTATTSYRRYTCTGTLSGSIAVDVTPSVTSTASVAIYGAQLVRDFVPHVYKSNPGSTVGGAGDTLVMTGTVPLATTSPLFAKGTGAGRRFVGPFSDANYFTRSTLGLSTLTACVAFETDTSSGAEVLVADSDAGATNSWELQYSGATAKARAVTRNGGVTTTVDSGNSVTLNALNVACFGFGGGTAYVKLNGGTTASAVATVGAGATTLYVGRYAGVAAPLSQGTLHEVWVTSTPWNEVSVAQIQANAMANGGKGPLFPDDANTALHLKGDAYDGTTWGAPHGALTTNGTVAYSDAWVPPVAGAEQRQGYGAYSDANYFTLGLGSDVLDFSSDYACHALFTPPTALGGTPALIGNSNTTPNQGWLLQLFTNGAARVWSNATFTDTTNAAVSGYNVVSWGRSGATHYVKMNLGAVASAGATTLTPATANSVKVGRFEGAGLSWGAGGVIHEIVCTNSAASDALFTRLQNRALGLLAAQGHTVAVTRTTTETGLIPGSGAQTLYTTPAGTLTQTGDGAQVYGADTNVALRSEEIDNASWANVGVPTVTANQYAFVDGQTTMEKIVAAAGAGRSQAVTVTSSTGPFTVSSWARADTGTAVQSVCVQIAGGNNVTSCTCSNSNGSSCSANTVASITCCNTTTVGTSPVRLSATASFTTASTTPTIIVAPGTYNSAGATGGFGGVQFEASPYVTPYIPTTTVAVTRNATQASVPANLSVEPYSCLKATITPASWSDTAVHTIATTGARGAANSTRLEYENGILHYYVFDSNAMARFVTTSVPTSGTHTVKGCANNANPILYVDGTAYVTGGGAGVGYSSATSTLTLGANPDASQPLDGAIREVDLSREPEASFDFQQTRTNILHVPFSSTGGTFQNDAGTVANIYWNGTALVDLKGNSWTQNGTVPQNVATPLYPSGFSGPQQKGAGPFSDVNYYSLSGTTLGFSSDFSMCIAFIPTNTATGTARVLFSKTNGTTGYDAQIVATTGVLAFFARGGAAVSTSNAVVANALNVGCFGRTGGTSAIKLNLSTIATLGTAFTLDTADAGLIGRYGPSAGFSASDVSIVAIWASTATPSDALFTQIQQRFFSMLGTRSEAVTVARASSTADTYTTPDGTIWSAPSNVARIGCEDAAATKCGVWSEPARTNAILQSEDLATTWVASSVNITVTTNQGTLSGRGVVMDQLAGAAATTVERVTQATTTTSTTGPFTVSAWVASTTGTVTATVGGFCPAANNATGVSCVRSDGGTCTTGTATVNGFAYGSVTTTPVRFMVTYSCTAATTTPGMFVAPGQYGTNTNATILAAAAQFEVGAYATTYKPTTTASAARAAETISVANPLATSNPASWCVDGTYTFENGRSVSSEQSRTFTTAATAGGWANTTPGATAGSLWNDSKSYIGTTSTGGQERTCSALHGFASGSTHNVKVGFSGADAYSIFLDGTSTACTLGGLGNGAYTTNLAVMTIGAGNAGGQSLAGLVRDFKVCPNACGTCQ